MCGITGYVSFNPRLEETIEKMVWSLKRVYDSNNYVLYTKNGNKYALGHTKLTLIFHLLKSIWKIINLL